LLVLLIGGLAGFGAEISHRNAERLPSLQSL
jgi:hypothetical protein